MKKLITILLIILLTGCANQTTSQENNSTNKTPDTSNTNESTLAIDNPIEINLKEKIEISDLLTFQIDTAEWTDEIYPSNTSGNIFIFI